MKTPYNKYEWPVLHKSKLRPYAECAEEEEYTKNKEYYTAAFSCSFHR